MYLPVPYDYNGKYETVTINVKRISTHKKDWDEYDEYVVVSDESSEPIYRYEGYPHDQYTYYSNIKESEIQSIIDDIPWNHGHINFCDCKYGFFYFNINQYEDGISEFSHEFVCTYQVKCVLSNK
jgi:hypothetical protein